MLKRPASPAIHFGSASMFDLNQLRCFVAVAEELHFSRAAARLNMTQPPLSRQIQVLEHIVDAPLLERTSRSVRLTPAGRSFLPEARRILKLAESASQVARRIAQGKTGSLKIGFTAGAAYGFVPELVRACRARLPDVDLSLKEMVTGDQMDALISGQLDAGLLRPPIQRAELATLRVAAEPLLAALPQDHPLLEVEDLSIRHFDAQDFLMYSPYESRYFHDLLATQFSRADILPHYVQHVSQIHSILAMVRAGLGAAIVPEAASNLAVKGVTLRPLKLRVNTPVELFLTWRRDAENPLLPLLVAVGETLASAQVGSD